MSEAGAVQQVVQALSVLYQDPNPGAKEKANAWLSEFQKSNEAWSTAQLILFAPDAPVETKLFAAQTFRTKITYDLDLLPPAHRLPLRDSLLTALRTFATGPRVILTQICIALADLALQLTPEEWNDPTTAMIELFGSEPAMAGALLEFLQVLAEEYNGNLKLEVKADFGRESKDKTKLSKGAQVVGLLSMYVQAPGITTALHNQSFACLGAWLKTGHATASSLSGSPLVTSLFAALASDELFDAAVDALVDLLHETQELDENMAIIQELVPLLAALRPQLLDPTTREDEDRMRGYCRILVEAGEWYSLLIVPHVESFLPLVESIAICASYDNLSVAGITLNFWYRLSRSLAKAKDDPKVQPLLAVYANLVGTIIRHLHYPEDDGSLTAQERDDFRNFRHTIGDTLKDCCTVLGATTCLRRSYEIISETLSTSGAAVKWQDLEAPLFSMRSMGAEVDPADNEVMPLIMDLLPKLPTHPKIRYAAILVIGRYTQWINQHPDHIAFQLPYVSSGFDDGDTEVSAAAAQTLKYLCKDCPHHLVAYLSQLHAFVQSVAGRIGAEDLLDISAGIAHIICVMPLEEAPAALSSFCMPNIELVHALNVQPTPATRAELRAACDALERIDMLLAIVDRFPEGLPTACAGTCDQAWEVLKTFLLKYAGQDGRVPEKVCVALRRGLHFFDDDAFRVAPSVLDTLSNAFEAAPASSYLWIMGKMVSMFARRGDQAYEEVLKVAVERSTSKIFTMLQQTDPAQLADILDDYVHLIIDLIEYHPELLLLSPSFPLCFQTLLSTTTLLSPQIVLSSLDALRAIIGHESLESPTPFPAAFGSSIRTVVEGASPSLARVLMTGVVDGFEDASTNILTILRMLAVQFPQVLVREMPAAVEQLPVKSVSPAERAEFLTKFQSSMSVQNPNQAKESFTWLLRTSKKSRERARVLEDRR
ncbi:transportin-3, partial [Phenoliferia sp. Uapishka_3]